MVTRPSSHEMWLGLVEALPSLNGVFGGTKLLVLLRPEVILTPRRSKNQELHIYPCSIGDLFHGRAWYENASCRVSFFVLPGADNKANHVHWPYNELKSIFSGSRGKSLSSTNTLAVSFFLELGDASPRHPPDVKDGLTVRVHNVKGPESVRMIAPPSRSSTPLFIRLLPTLCFHEAMKTSFIVIFCARTDHAAAITPSTIYFAIIDVDHQSPEQRLCH